MTLSPQQIEAEAREALLYAREACARSLELRGQVGVANEFRIGRYDGLPDIQMRVAAYLAGRSAALSLRPTSQDDAGLCERLRDLANAYDAAGEDNGVGTMREAADRIATLSADAARMREALAQWKCGACGGSGIYLNHYRDGGPEGYTLVTQEVTCTVCGGTGQHPTARAALSGETK